MKCTLWEDKIKKFLLQNNLQTPHSGYHWDGGSDRSFNSIPRQPFKTLSEVDTKSYSEYLFILVTLLT